MDQLNGTTNWTLVVFAFILFTKNGITLTIDCQGVEQYSVFAASGARASRPPRADHLD